MISKLPRWVWSGGWALAFVAGMINVVGLLGYRRNAITHLTSNKSLLAAALASRCCFGVASISSPLSVLLSSAR